MKGLILQLLPVFLETAEVGVVDCPQVIAISLAKLTTNFSYIMLRAIFCFNPLPTVYNHFKQTDQEKKLFSLKGKKNNKKRMTIYTFLLSHMSDQHRFQLTAKLCQVIKCYIFGESWGGEVMYMCGGRG